MTTKNRQPALVLGARSVDATPTPPPAGYVPEQSSAPEQTASAPANAAPPASPATPADESPADPAGDSAGDSSSAQQHDAADAAADAADSAAADAADAADAAADDEDAEPTYADESQVQAARLAMRAYSKARDALPEKAAAAVRALEGLRRNNGSDAQVLSVLADGRVKPRELGLDRRGRVSVK